MDAPLWQQITLFVILLGMLMWLASKKSDCLDRWTFMGEEPKEFTLYGMTKRQIRRLRTFYINRTGDTKLERL